MILIDGLFVNKGGGAVLFKYLIETIMQRPDKDKFFFLLDPRLDIPESLTGNYLVIPNKTADRKKFYKKHQHSYRKVLCFANTPPPVKMKAETYTYFHNQKLLEAPGQKFKKMFWSQYIKYLYVKVNAGNTNYFIVQTPHMVEGLVEVGLKDKKHCLTIPFYDSAKYTVPHSPFEDRRKDEFVFISNPTPQKNYPALLDAWEELHKRGLTPTLHVTIDETAPTFTERVKQMNEKGMKVVNHTYIDPRELYFSCPYLIFPSLMESFGLPLIEAAESGMKILASDLPFVYDVVTPSLVFDQSKPAAIAAAVVKAMNDKDLPFPKVVTHNHVHELIDLLAR
jgi:glycosyltransferase involved in cell wall biosynthesis